MTSQSYVNIILSFLLAFLLWTCDSSHKRCENRYYFSDEFKSYTFFNEGSYWVYEDSTYHKIDSVYISYQSIILHDECDGNSKFEERLTQHIYSSYFQTNTDYFSLSIGASVKKYTLIGKAYPMGHYWINGEKLDSVKVNNVWYKDITVCETSGGNRFYWAKNIGLIKKPLRYPYNNDTLIHFELLRYHIE